MKEALIIKNDIIVQHGIYPDKFSLEDYEIVYVSNWKGQTGDSVSDYDEDWNRIVVNTPKIEIPEEVQTEEACEDNQEETLLSEIEIRKSEIMNRLNEIDYLSVRPIRAILSNSATDFDKEKLESLEKEADELRKELATL